MDKSYSEASSSGSGSRSEMSDDDMSCNYDSRSGSASASDSGSASVSESASVSDSESGSGSGSASNSESGDNEDYAKEITNSRRHDKKKRKLSREQQELANIQLENAAIAGDLEKVKEAIENGADIHYRNNSALYFASHFKHPKLVDYLYTIGIAQKENRGKTRHHGMHYGEKKWHHGMNYGEKKKPHGMHYGEKKKSHGMHYGEKERHHGMHYGEKKKPHGMHYGEKKRHGMNYMKKHGQRYGLSQDERLVLGANRGDVEMVLSAVNNGADIHYNHDAALYWAAEKGHLSLVQLILNIIEHQEGKEAVKNAANAANYDIYLAAWTNNHQNVLRYLVSRGANVKQAILTRSRPRKEPEYFYDQSE